MSNYALLVIAPTSKGLYMFIDFFANLHNLLLLVLHYFLVVFLCTDTGILVLHNIYSDFCTYYSIYYIIYALY